MFGSIAAAANGLLANGLLADAKANGLLIQAAQFIASLF